MRITVALTLTLCLSAAPLLPAQERKLIKADLPAPVAATATAQSQGATVLGYAREVEDGKTTYEVSLTVNGHKRDVVIDPTGAVVVVEDEVVLNNLPAPVQAALKAKAGKGTFVVVESLTKGGRLVAYEAHVKTGSKTREVMVGPNGEALAKEP